MTRVIGMDPSLSQFGIAYRQGERVRAYSIKTGKLRGFARLQYLEEGVSAILDVTTPDIVVYEDYAMAGKGRVFHIGELGGVIKMLILRRGIGILSVPPTSMKMFTTGSGGGKSKDSKARVQQAVIEQTGQTFASSDEYDATALLMMGEAYCNRRILPRDRRHYKRRALEGCEFVTI